MRVHKGMSETDQHTLCDSDAVSTAMPSSAFLQVQWLTNSARLTGAGLEFDMGGQRTQKSNRARDVIKDGQCAQAPLRVDPTNF